MITQGGISFRLARISILFAFLLGVLLGIIEIWVDFKEEKAGAEERAHRALRVSSPSAGDSAHQLDQALAEQVVEGLLHHDFITAASIVDDSGNVLARQERVPTDQPNEWLTGWLADPNPTYEAALFDPVQGFQVGSLKLETSMNVALTEFYGRLAVHLLSGVVRSVALAAILFVTYFYFLGHPLRSLSEAIGNVNPTGSERIDIIDSKHEHDELGALQTSTNGLLDTVRQSLRNLEHAREELLLNEQRMGDFARAGSDWFWETDAEHMPQYLSDGFFELTGRDPETHSSTVRAAYKKDGASDFPGFRELVAVLTARKTFRDFNTTIVKADGGRVPVRISGVPLFCDKGDFLGFRGIASDCTDLKRSEEERARLSEELNHAQRLRAIGQLTGGVAHDFNNVLAVIMGCLEIIQSDQTSKTQSDEAISLAIGATKRGSGMTHRLLAYSRQQPLSPKPLDPKQVLTALDGLLRRTLSERIELEIVVNGGLWRCFADRQELETVILNLAINARDAMPDGGKLTIEAYNSRLDEEYAMSGSDVTPGQYVCFAITDTGVGMDEDTVERAFDPYFTTKPVGEGSGLGLSMAFGFVKQSKGHIKIYSEVGNGTTIKVYLPRSSGIVPDDHDSKTQTSNADILKGRRILVVEDEAAVLRTLEMRLARFGCEIVSAGDANIALEKCAADPRFDIFLLDVVLPGKLKGPELAEALLDLSPGAKVIFMSGYTKNAIVHGGQLDEGVRLLQKPFTSAQLQASLIQSILEDGEA